ncbi:cytochrome c maturation protein CcmE [Rhizobium ruizarguesonis]|uniref:cytochrome c maturation protein CcmE n=1 Tax=Rhizobium ruizarguesonis TaxID=2081791 RepID=UPI0026C120EA|nr:cytochrome c maturation protein CcmE [Rhizobium ruizarguesonis]
MTRKQKRLVVIAGGMGFIAAAVLLVMFAFSQSVAYFYMPADLAKTPVAPETRIRLGGLVGEGSVVRDTGSTVEFAVTDGSSNAVVVKYTGILPDLFREGQGVVTEGIFATGTNCLIRAFDGALFSLEWREALWARFYTGAPRRQRQSVEQYKIVKRA